MNIRRPNRNTIHSSALDTTPANTYSQELPTQHCPTNPPTQKTIMGSNVTTPGGEKHNNVADTAIVHTKLYSKTPRAHIPKVIEFDLTRFQLKNTKQ